MQQECRAGFQGFACQPRQISGKERKKRRKKWLSVGQKRRTTSRVIPAVHAGLTEVSRGVAVIWLATRHSAGGEGRRRVQVRCLTVHRLWGSRLLKAQKLSVNWVCVDKGPISFLMNDWKRRSYGQSRFCGFVCRSRTLQEVDACLWYFQLSL